MGAKIKGRATETESSSRASPNPPRLFSGTAYEGLPIRIETGKYWWRAPLTGATFA